MDDDYPHDEPFYAFVHMTGVRGVGVTGCSFSNNMSIAGDGIADWGYGIYADDAGFNVGAKCEGNPVPYPLPCPGYTFSEFNNLGYGIYAAMIVTNRPYSVRQSNFNDCFVGIRNKSVSGGTILFNNFNLGTLPSTAFTQQQIGVSFETGITGFTFQENDFFGDPNSGIETIGSACKNTGSANKTVRKNQYYNQADYDAQPTEPKLVQMGAYRRAMDDNAYMVVLHEMYDTLDFNEDILLAWVENLNSLPADLWRANEQLANGNLTRANQILDAAPSKFSLTSEQQTDVDNYQAIANLIGSQWAYSLSEASLQSIKAFDDGGGNTEGWAQNILTHYGAHYPPVYETSRGSGERSSEGEPERDKIIRNLPLVTVQPNPAGNHATFYLNLSPETENIAVQVRDFNGRLVARFTGLSPHSMIEWDTAGNPSGVYFFQLTADGSIRQSGKIILNK